MSSTDALAYEATGPGDLFGVIDLNTGVFTSVGSTGQTLAGLGSYNGTIYGGAYHGNTLYSIDTSTGALTAIGTGNIGSNYLLLGSTTSGLYGMGWNDVLYSIDPATGAATEIGSTGLPIGGVMGMSAGGNTLYVTYNNSLYALNTTNGSGTLVATTTEGEAGFGALVSVGGVLYGGAYNGAATPDVYVLDPETGAATFVAASPSTPSTSGVAGFYGLAPVVAAVTPTVALKIDNTDVNVVNGTGTVTFFFSEAPTAFTLTDTSAVGGRLSNLQQIDATHYTATFTGSANTDISTASVSVTASSYQDLADNAGAGGSTASFTVDTVTPTVAVSIDNTVLNVANPTGLVTFTFSKAPTDFSLNDVTSADGSLSNLSGSGTTYTATFTANAGVDDNAATVSVINGSYHDADGNAGTGASTMSPVNFSSAVATFYEVQNDWAPSQMIDGIFTGPPPSPGQDATYGGVNGWSVYDFNAGMADGADALLTLATPLPAGQYNLTFRIYQNYYGNPGHILRDFALDYTTDASPTLSSPQTPVSIQSASSLNGTTFSFLSPGELLANTSQNSIGIDTYTISALVDAASPITGIFLDAIKNPALPGGGRQGRRHRHRCLRHQRFGPDRRVLHHRRPLEGLPFSGGTNGTYTTLPDDPSAGGGPGVAPLAINDWGQIVGYYNDSNGSHGFLYSNGIYTTLAVPGGTNILADGINENAGQVVGWYFDSSGIEQRLSEFTAAAPTAPTPRWTIPAARHGCYVGPHLIAGM